MYSYISFDFAGSCKPIDRAVPAVCYVRGKLRTLFTIKVGKRVTTIFDESYRYLDTSTDLLAETTATNQAFCTNDLTS